MVRNSIVSQPSQVPYCIKQLAHSVSASLRRPAQFFSLVDSIQYRAKLVLVGSIALFEIGCLVSGLSTSSGVLILGRLLAGFGSARMNTGCLT
jgi:MFS family permease